MEGDLPHRGWLAPQAEQIWAVEGAQVVSRMVRVVAPAVVAALAL